MCDKQMLELIEAQAYIAKTFKRLTGNYCYIKEKYGTLRYEHTYTWLDTAEDFIIFTKIIKKAVRKFPLAAGAIVDDLVGVMHQEYDAGWCAGVLYASGGGEWVSSKPKDGNLNLFKKYHE